MPGTGSLPAYQVSSPRQPGAGSLPVSALPQEYALFPPPHHLLSPYWYNPTAISPFRTPLEASQVGPGQGRLRRVDARATNRQRVEVSARSDLERELWRTRVHLGCKEAMVAELAEENSRLRRERDELMRRLALANEGMQERNVREMGSLQKSHPTVAGLLAPPGSAGIYNFSISQGLNEDQVN